jgi:hypothetical protein
MKKLSLIGTALLAFTATAQAAPKIPAEFHGTWCSTPTDKVKGANDFPRGNTRQDFVGMACSEPEGGFEITITAQGFEAYGGEMSCKVIKVEKFLLNNVCSILGDQHTAYSLNVRWKKTPHSSLKYGLGKTRKVTS